MFGFRLVLLPRIHSELQPRRRCAFQVHPSCLQDGPDQRSGANLPREQLLQRRESQDFPQGGQVERSTSAHHSLRPIRFCSRSRAVSLPKQQPEVHRDIRPGMFLSKSISAKNFRYHG